MNRFLFLFVLLFSFLSFTPTTLACFDTTIKTVGKARITSLLQKGSNVRLCFKVRWGKKSRGVKFVGFRIPRKFDISWDSSHLIMKRSSFYRYSLVVFPRQRKGSSYCFSVYAHRHSYLHATKKGYTLRVYRSMRYMARWFAKQFQRKTVSVQRKKSKIGATIGFHNLPGDSRSRDGCGPKDPKWKKIFDRQKKRKARAIDF